MSIKGINGTPSELRAIAARGDADDQFDLGLMYRNGEGVPQDDTEAAKWFRKAAEQGHPNAQNWLGWMHQSGKGVPKSDVEAVKWYLKASVIGYAAAQFNLARIYQKGTGVQQNDVEAAHWCRKAAEQGHAKAQVWLGGMYENGKGVPQDYAEAAVWYRKAAAQGNADAQFWLGYQYYVGKGVSQDNHATIKWYRMAADQGHMYAQFNLGAMYEKGEGVEQNDVEAVKWYQKAAEQGHEQAQQKLAQLKAKGIGTNDADSKSHTEQAVEIISSGTTAKKTRTAIRHLRDAEECKALLDACAPHLYINNAFRISGLPVDATMRDIKRRIDDLKSAEEMGDLEDELSHAFALDPAPSLDQIREAAQRLQEPERRIIDEFFWFWPFEPGKSNIDLALKALMDDDKSEAIKIWSDALSDNHANKSTVAKHNLAIVYHIQALDSEQYALNNKLSDEQLLMIANDWHTCFKWWEELADDETLWSMVADRIRTIDDQRLTTGFARRMRATLPEAMDKINAMLARDYAERDKYSQATNHIKYMNETHQGKDNVPKILSIIIKPLKARVDNAVDTATNTANNKPDQAARAAFELLEAVSAPLKVIQIMLPAEDHERIDICDSVAEACLKCQNAYARGNKDWATSFKILDAALKYAASKETINRLTEKRLTVVTSQYLDPIYEFCNTISENIEKNPNSADQEAHRVINEAPKYLLKLSSAKVPDEILSLGKDQFALILDHCAVVFGNKTEKWKTCIKILEEAQKYSSSQEVKSRIEKNLSTVKKNESIGEPISSAPSLSSFYGIGFNLYGSSDADPETGSYLSRYYITILGIPVFPIRRYRVIPIENGYRFLGKAPLRTFDKVHLSASLALLAIFIFYNISQNNSETNRQSSPPSYNPRVSSPAQSNDSFRDSSPAPSYEGRNNRSALAQEIKNGKSRAKQLEEQITDMDNQLDDYKRRAKYYQDADMINEYNDLVPTFNALVRERNKLFNEYKSLIDEVNANVQRYNRR